MSSTVSSIWRRVPTDLTSRLDRCLHDACSRLTQKKSGYVFFRADDVAVPGLNINRLLSIFEQRRSPLCLAVVPAWFTSQRWEYLISIHASDARLWCWHQHGWRHANHAKQGKRQEFGPDRIRSDVRKDLLRGRSRLEEILGEAFVPVFTPPWNRCASQTLDLLRELNFAAVSRTVGCVPEPPEGLPDFFVNVDLHTRSEQNAIAGWDRLFNELEEAIASGHCGIMIHHQRMNSAAFQFLEILLNALLQRKELQVVHFGHLVKFDL